jgi:hypothetical protein
MPTKPRPERYRVFDGVVHIYDVTGLRVWQVPCTTKDYLVCRIGTVEVAVPQDAIDGSSGVFLPGHHGTLMVTRKWADSALCLSGDNQLEKLWAMEESHVPADAPARKALPLCTGVLDYFPDALIAVAEVSRIGNDQHNPGQPLHWAKEKSTDEADALARHLIDPVLPGRVPGRQSVC